MSDLATLVAKIEGATGPSREIDAEIAFDLFARPWGRKGIDGGPSGYLWPEDNPSWSFGIRFPGKDRDWFKSVRTGIGGETLLIERDGALVLMNALRVKSYTTSIDAAITLIPPGHAFSLHVDADGTVFAGVMLDDGDGCDNADQLGATAALALCAAAIRARMGGKK